MNFLSLIGIECRKIRRSKILLLLAAAVIIYWIPSILNARLNFTMQAEGISPEHNFMIQGFLGMSWFIFPASMMVSIVLMHQTERAERGMLKMMALPVNMAKLCLAKFILLLMLAVLQLLLMVGMYYVSAAIVTRTQNYAFCLPAGLIFREAGLLFVSSVPMLAVFWLLSVCISTPIFSIGAGLASVVPSVIAINTKIWYVYPMCYPFYVITAEYGKLAENLSEPDLRYPLWIPIAIGVAVVSLLISCLMFGQAERR